MKKKAQKNEQVTPESNEKTPPELVRRREHRRSTLKTGRTLSAKREQLETSTDRILAHQKFKKRQKLRILFTILIFVLAIAALVGLGILLSKTTDDNTEPPSDTTITYKPTIEIIDEDSPTGNITNRMKEFVGQAEVDFRELGLIPIKAVIPTGSIREVDFYLDGHSGCIKMIIDRDTAVSVEDASRMIKYLEKQGITEYQYIDVRISGKAYWK